jgi:hypothetical protein
MKEMQKQGVQYRRQKSKCCDGVHIEEEWENKNAVIARNLWNNGMKLKEGNVNIDNYEI